MKNSICLSTKNANSLTTKELAKQLNTSSKVILENAKKCLPNKTIENGKPTYWTQAEITVLIDCLKNNSSNHASDLYFESKGAITTELTPALKIKKAFDLMQEGYQEEIARLEALNAAQKPKVEVYDNLVERNKLLNFRDMAAKLGMKQTEFMTILKAKYIYKTTKGEYRAYADYANLFATRTYAKGVDKTGDQLLLTMEGVSYFLEKYSKLTEKVADKWLEKAVQA